MIRTLYTAERARLIRFGRASARPRCADRGRDVRAVRRDAGERERGRVRVLDRVFVSRQHAVEFSSPVTWGNFVRFLAVALAGLGMTMLLAHGTETLGLARAWSIVAVVLCVPPVTFVLHRLWTYR